MKRILISFILLIIVVLACDLALADNAVPYRSTQSISTESLTMTAYAG